tara:strand:- start:2817 stop:3320 length:504 start_codon:yes stop_codon:yes gene_type:complete
MWFRLVFGISALFASTAAADVYEECVAAMADGNKDAAIAATETILRFRPAPRGLSDEVFECFKFATGNDYGYAPRTGLLVTLEQQEIAQKEADEEAKIADRKKAEIQAATDRQKQVEIELAQAEADLRRKVQTRLVQACGELYQDRPNETITNKLCYDVFMVIGLPE